MSPISAPIADVLLIDLTRIRLKFCAFKHANFGSNLA